MPKVPFQMAEMKAAASPGTDTMFLMLSESGLYETLIRAEEKLNMQIWQSKVCYHFRNPCTTSARTVRLCHLTSWCPVLLHSNMSEVSDSSPCTPQGRVSIDEFDQVNFENNPQKKLACFAMVLLLQLLAELSHDLQRRYFPHHLDDAEAAEPPTPEVHRILGQAAKDVLQVRRKPTCSFGAQVPLSTQEHMAPDPASCALTVTAFQGVCCSAPHLNKLCKLHHPHKVSLCGS